MGRISLGILIAAALSSMLPSAGHCASWDQSTNKALSIRHPQGWRASWAENGVAVVDPQNEMIWCEVRTHKGSGGEAVFLSTRLLSRVVECLEDAAKVADAAAGNRLRIGIEGEDLHRYVPR